MKKGLIDIHICYRDRPTELGLLLLSLYTQTYKNFRILISDDASGTPMATYHFLNCMIMRLNLSGTNVIINRNDFGLGVSKNRQRLVDMSIKDDVCEFICRVDDDVILEDDFLERLIKVINEGYDLASGITPPMAGPTLKREIIPEIGNRVVLDNDGNYIFNGDDFGMMFFDEKIIPAHHFRSSALYKKEIHEKVNYTPTKLTKHGFREENLFSYKCIVEGYTIGVDVQAIAHHMMTPSGGERFQDSSELIKQNQKVFEEQTREMFKKHGNFIEEYNKKLGIKPKELTKQDLMKETNLARLR